MRLLLDMNLSPAWVAFLAGKGLAATHWSTVGHAAETDRIIMTYAAQNRMIVMTNDLDFGILLAAQQQNTPSVVQLRARDLRPQSIGDTVVRALEQARSDLEAGALLTIDLQRVRLRLLPLRKL